MSFDSAREHLRKFGRDRDIITPAESTATVELAAAALGTQPERIAKTLSFYGNDGAAILIVTAGTARTDNRKFKDHFGFKPKMLAHDDVETLTGHAPGGVCPFGVHASVAVYLDESLRDFDYVYPACGNPNSAIKLTLAELELYSAAAGWVDVTSPPRTV